ncbi:MAG: hypothetical protein M1814_003197 [Vezdaea aestivalis]|nr:MAG: hypothetical protein M1814_003197 [Vezdaea aestivalis]
MARSGSFATFLILCPTSFFLGILFSQFPYDYPILWVSSGPPEGFYTQLETHLRLLHASPPIIPRILHIVIFVGLSGFVAKLYRPSEANVLFDGASLVLYMVALTVYITNFVKGLRVVTAGEYGVGIEVGEGEAGVVIGREDSLKVISASNTILALVLVGVLVLQAGQWYAERKEGEQLEKFRLEEEREKAAPRRGASAKKKN